MSPNFLHGGGALGGGFSTALQEDTWPDGISVGLGRVTQAALLSGAGGSAFGALAGASVHLLQKIPIRQFFRNLISEEAGAFVVDVSLWRQIRTARAAGQTMEEFFTASTSRTVSEQIDSLANQLRTSLATLGDADATAARTQIRQMLSTTLTQDERILLEELAVTVWRKERPNLANLSNAALRTLLVGAMDETAREFTNSIAGMVSAIRAFHAGLDDAAAEQVAIQLFRGGNAESATIRSALQTALGSAPNETVVEAMRLLLTRPGIPTNVAAAVTFTGNLGDIQAHELAQAIRYAQREGGGSFNWFGNSSAGIEGTFTRAGTSDAIGVTLKQFGPLGERNIRTILNGIRDNMTTIRNHNRQGAVLYTWINFSAEEWERIALNGPLTLATAGPNTPPGAIVTSMIGDGALSKMLFHTSDGRIVEITSAGVRVLLN